MKDIRKLGSQCMADLASINIPYGKVRLWGVNCRAKARWGLCKKRPDGCCEIEIAEALLQDDVSDIAVKNTIIHELLHTCPGCFKHTGRWKQYADRVNRYLPQYNIKRTTSAEEKGVAVRRKEPVYRYILKCCDCGYEIKRQKQTVVISLYLNNFKVCILFCHTYIRELLRLCMRNLIIFVREFAMIPYLLDLICCHAI